MFVGLSPIMHRKVSYFISLYLVPKHREWDLSAIFQSLTYKALKNLWVKLRMKIAHVCRQMLVTEKKL